MRTLIIDTATSVCSVALYDQRELVASADEIIGRGHAERLLPFIADLPENGKAERIMVNVGPGSFTGIRVGIAAARALAFAWQAELGGYNCLQLVVAMARERLGRAEAIDVFMTGGHGEYFHQYFDEMLSPGSPLQSLPIGQVQRALRGNIVAGDIAFGNHVSVLPNADKWHLIADIPTLAPKPLYGRGPDAKPPQRAAA